MVAGDICLDFTPKFPQQWQGAFAEIFVPGKVVNVEECIISTGGPVSNAGLALTKLGVNVTLSGKIGDDLIGKCIIECLGEERIRDFKVQKGQTSASTIVIVPPNIDRIFLHHPGTNNTFGADDVNYDEVAGCCLFHLGYPPVMRRLYSNQGKELVEMLKRVKQLGVTTSLDMSLPDPASESGQINWEKFLENTLPLVDIFLPSIEETTYMLDRALFEKRKAQAGGKDPVLFYQAEDYCKLSKKVMAYGVKIFALKSGIRGFYLRTNGGLAFSEIGPAAPEDVRRWQDRELWGSSFTAEPFGSATGSGDSAIAGFLAAYLRGFSPEDCVQIANIVGWQNVRGIDAISTIEDWPATIELLRDKNKKRNELKLDGQGWNYDSEKQLYCGPDDR